MARARQRINPFYLLLVAIGILFTVTASAYYVRALRGSAPAAVVPAAPTAFTNFIDRHGLRLLLGELGLLALCTIGAISTDNWWNSPSRRTLDDASAGIEPSSESRHSPSEYKG